MAGLREVILLWRRSLSTDLSTGKLKLFRRNPRLEIAFALGLDQMAADKPSAPMGSVAALIDPSPAPASSVCDDLSFVGKLSIMLQDPAALPFVSWSSSEDSILILDRTQFSSKILPRCFQNFLKALWTRGWYGLPCLRQILQAQQHVFLHTSIESLWVSQDFARAGSLRIFSPSFQVHCQCAAGHNCVWCSHRCS